MLLIKTHHSVKYQEFKPSKPLEAFVRCYYIIECEESEIVEDIAFATGSLEVMITFQGHSWQTRQGPGFRQTSDIELWGQILNPLPFRTTGSSQIFGIRFTPQGATILLRENISQFNNTVIDLTLLLGRGITELKWKLQESKSMEERIAHTEKYLWTNKGGLAIGDGKITLLKSVMKDLTNEDAFDNINTVAGRYGISSRYLRRIFAQYTGLSPKLFYKVNRFQHSLRCINNHQASLTDIAHTCNYFDQSHFIREFKFFTGSAPSQLVITESVAILSKEKS